MTIERNQSRILAREQRWSERVTAQLPALLTRLLDSPVYGLTAGRPRPPDAYGVYLFSERSRPRYVGRVGLTEPSRLAGKRFSNFRTRLNGHTRPRHGEGTYAYTRTCESLRQRGVTLAATRDGNCANPEFMHEFRRQCQRVRDMDFQVVEINDNRLAAVFEIYAAGALGLNQSFAVS
jgi:hypothetical protein